MNNTSAALFRASNVVILDYPLDAALSSALSVCDEAVVVVDTHSVDHTVDLVYTLQKAWGWERLTVVEREWQFDRAWQEKVWDWGAEATKAEWLMFHDADEAIHEENAPVLRALMECREVKLIRFPFVHLYATPHYKAAFTLTHNTRLGRRSAGYRMRNWCTEERPQRAACQMVYGPDEINAHIPANGIVTAHFPILHYGWCRTAQALAISQAKQGAWYANGGGLEDGRIPRVVPYDFLLQHKVDIGFVTRYEGTHPTAMRDWFAAHEAEWEALENE